MHRFLESSESALVAAAVVYRWLKLALAVTLVAASVGCAGPSQVEQGALLAPEPAVAGVSPSAFGEAVAVSNSGPSDESAAPALEGRAGNGLASTASDAASVEELLEQGLRLAGASPVHLAIRGTPAANSVRCAWRGVARTAAQRESAIRFLLGLDSDDPVPSVANLATFFAVALDSWNPDYRETSKAHFLGIARGGLSTDYLFLTCFADYAVTGFLLGTGTTPTTVTVAYDRRAQARSYDLYVREHDSGTFGDAALAARGAYEASLQELVVAAEKALSDDIGGREAVVFLAPMGAHNAIGFEAWQTVVSWAVVTDDANVVQAIRDDTPEGDPEHTQTLANLTSRITTGAAADGQATSRVTTGHERVASLSIAGARMAKFDYANPRTHAYRICDYTFPPENPTGWKEIIDSAFEPWRVAIGDLINVANKVLPCADHTHFIDESVRIASEVIIAMNASEGDIGSVSQETMDESR